MTPELLVLEPLVDVVVVVVVPAPVLEVTPVVVVDPPPVLEVTPVVVVVVPPPVVPVCGLVVVAVSTTTLPPQAARVTTAAKTKFFMGGSIINREPLDRESLFVVPSVRWRSSVIRELFRAGTVLEGCSAARIGGCSPRAEPGEIALRQGASG
jgi:hypothetical protein